MENDLSNVQSQAPPAPPVIPVNPPPLITPPPPPKTPRRGNGWMKAAIVLAVLLVLSLLGNLRRVVHSGAARGKAGRPAHERLEEVAFENNHSKNKIALLDISGIISSEPWDRSGASMVDLISD